MNQVIVEHVHHSIFGMPELRVIVTEDTAKTLKDFAYEFLESLSVDKTVIELIFSKEAAEVSELLKEEYDIAYSENKFLFLPQTKDAPAVGYDVVKTYDIDGNVRAFTYT